MAQDLVPTDSLHTKHVRPDSDASSERAHLNQIECASRKNRMQGIAVVGPYCALACAFLVEKHNV